MPKKMAVLLILAKKALLNQHGIDICGPYIRCNSSVTTTGVQEKR